MPQMHPAPDFQWNQAHGILRRLLGKHGITGPDADDAIQDWTLATIRRDYAVPPYDPPAAAYMTCALVRRRGITAMLAARRNALKRRKRTGLEEIQPMGEPVGVREAAPPSCDPAVMAEAGETLAERMPRFAQRARAVGMTPAALALVAAGWGPLDDEDAAKASPSVPQCGPGYTPPDRGCPGLHTATDPNPASREASRAAAARELAVLAAGGIQPRRREQAAEPTAAEQANQAREAWEAFKARNEKND